MGEEKIVNNYYQTNIKTSRNEHSVYAMKYASQQMLIDKLQQENQQLKEQLENNDCKRIYNKFVNYKNWYFEYVDKCEKYKSVLDEIREYIKELDDNTDDIACYDIDRNVRDDLLQILDKVGSND